MSADDREFLVTRVHYLRHVEGLSVRQILAALAEAHNVRRSVGWVAGALKDWECGRCGVQEYQKAHLNTSDGGDAS
ncbi:hypothetical protein [Streptomyces endophyticus]|uniref:Uncharacterized protein n=1 Tax=Streptomyces endophyticus TaxID=714166 RepID=A0ABU6FCP9_9ACTN|nr:hypothetical protein [Streptomyces endophyticus]MEB8341798.1 hypothetical protein [Streptomyces endophyticus]